MQWWWIDALLAVAVVAISRATVHPATGADVLGRLALADRRAVYTNMLQLTIIFAGFGGVGFAIYLGLGSRAVRQVKLSAGAPLLRVWLAALVTPWVCALLLVFCGMTDSGDKGSANFTRWIALASLVIVVLQMTRIIWIFYQLAATDLQSSRAVAAVSAEEVRIIGPRAS